MDKSKWEYKKLCDVALIIMGQSPSSDSYNEEGKGLPFLGCTNYNTDGSGCNNMISQDAYVRMYGKKDK